VCDYRLQKSEPERTRLTVGGNLIEYPSNVATSIADLTTAKILWNSTISTPDARFMCMDVKNFYLNTPMDQPEYMQILVKHIPDEIMMEYILHELVYKGFTLALRRECSYRVHAQQKQPITGLLCYTTNGHSPIRHQRHAITSTLRHKLSQQAQGTKPHWSEDTFT
jgi:hypothetical protein